MKKRGIAFYLPWGIGLSIFFLFLVDVYAETGLRTNPGIASSSVEDPGNITLDFKEADITTVLRVLSLKNKVNIVAGPEVRGTVTIRLEDVPWEKALDVVLRTYDYVYERDENIIRVTTREKMAQEPVVTNTYILNYSTATEIMSAVRDMLTERGRIRVAERTNTIVITDIPTNLYRIGNIIKNLDRITPQANIDTKIIRTDVAVAENLGIQWQTGGAENEVGGLSGMSRPTTFPFSLNQVNPSTDVNNVYDENISRFVQQFFPFVGTTDRVIGNPQQIPIPAFTDTGAAFAFGTLDFSGFGAILQMLQSRANTKVVSHPRITVLNNQTAHVQVGREIPLPQFERNRDTGAVEVTGFTYRDVGVVLNVTPHINSAREILVDLRPEVSSMEDDMINFGDFQVPAFTVTEATTQVLIRSGETIAIGGLMTDNVAISESRLPGLSRIPIIGKLFRSKRQTPGDSNQKSETLFFVTVTMVDTEGQPVITIAEEEGEGEGEEAADSAADEDIGSEEV